MIISLRNFLTAVFTQLNVKDEWCDELAQISSLLIVFLFTIFLTYVSLKYIMSLVLKIVKRTETVWDDYLINESVLKALCQLFPALIVYYLIPSCLDDKSSIIYIIVYRITQLYITFCVSLFVNAFLKNFTHAAIVKIEEYHLVGILQFLRLMNFSLAAIVAIALLFGSNPLQVIAGLGAAATVLMFIFKDSILGLVAGIQLSVNKMLKVGDWVTLDKMKINGFVEEITLTTIKIRNFDNTISTVPPYVLVSESFQSWSGMFAKGYRRVKRVLYIDINSIHFMSKNEYEQLKAKKILCLDEDKTEPMTNLTCYRNYIISELKKDPLISKKQWMMVRQLEVTPSGLPIEVWFYTSETSFVFYENFASKYMELFIARLPEFGLKPFQLPTGIEISNMFDQEKTLK